MYRPNLSIKMERLLFLQCPFKINFPLLNPERDLFIPPTKLIKDLFMKGLPVIKGPSCREEYMA